MVREEQIRQTSDAFEEGIKQTDEHSKNPWISVSDKLPFECEETRLTENLTKTVIVNTYLCKKMLAYMIVINDIWVWRDTRGNLIDTVTCWMPTPKLTYED